MKNNPNKTTVLATIWLTLIFTISCYAANNPSALVGRWVGVSGDEKGVVVELLSDGTGIVTQNSVGVAITWKTEKDRFYTVVSGFAEAENYKLQGSRLAFTKDDGKVNEYMKCNKDCSEIVKEYDKAKAKKEAAEFAKIKSSGSFTDSRDGKSYKTVEINSKIWMAENLNYNASGSKCYDNDESNCQKYGRLYNWSTALTACPKGWHLPSNAEWGTLVDLAGGEKAGNILKASNGWKNNGNGVDAVGFSALPGGRGYSDGSFNYVGNYGYWWSASEYLSDDAYYRYMDCNYESVNYYNNGKGYLYSVRCLQD